MLGMMVGLEVKFANGLELGLGYIDGVAATGLMLGLIIGLTVGLVVELVVFGLTLGCKEGNTVEFANGL